MRRMLTVLAGMAGLTVALASPAFACGGLIGPNGAVNLTRTSTFAGYHDGVEHYVTAFSFAGGGAAVGKWATDHGFRLPPDAPEVLDFYAKRSPIFLAAAFDADAARKRGQQIGDGTPVHITIPTDNPWVPLRILSLGKSKGEFVDADVYLLTDHRPNLLSTSSIGKGFSPQPLSVTYDEKASDQLLTDLRTDKTGSWVPKSGWLTKVRVAGPAESFTGDLAIDASGKRLPSMVKAGYSVEGPLLDRGTSHRNTAGLVALGVLAAWLLIAGTVAATKRASS